MTAGRTLKSLNFKGVMGVVVLGAGLWAVPAGDALAQALTPRPRGEMRAHPGPARVLTVHRRSPRFVVARRIAPASAGPGLLRRWNDPDLYSFGGWRIGGDAFYGDTRGDPITRGNASLGMISGYGGARGGYGGPHFDSVGGFHDGPGPEAREAAIYASGSISTPDYGDIVPRYPSLRARVAALTTGVVSHRSSRGLSVGFGRPSSSPPAPSATSRNLREDDLVPSFGFDAF